MATRQPPSRELVEHMEINRQSLYDTFGDKHALYLRRLSIAIRQSRRARFLSCSRIANSGEKASAASCSRAWLKDRSARVSNVAASWATRCRS